VALVLLVAAIAPVHIGAFRCNASGVNLTFVSHMPQSRRTNVKFKNATRNLSLLVVLAIPTFGRGHAKMGAKCRNRTTSQIGGLGENISKCVPKRVPVMGGAMQGIGMKHEHPAGGAAVGGRDRSFASRTRKEPWPCLCQ
jgi:hypothetical protein